MWWMWGTGVVFVLAQALALVQTLGASVSPSTEPQPSHVLLSSLHPAQLERVLESQLTRLREDVLRIYQEELRQHDQTIDKIHRVKRSTPSHLPDSDFWHSYVYNTGVGNREEVKVEDIESIGYLGTIEIVDVFPINLPNLPAIYKGSDGRGYVEVNGTMKVLTVRNAWTISSSGCDCGDGRHKDCACCKQGSCLCSRSEGYHGDSCVPCGTLHINCPTASPRELELDAAVGFQYHVQQGGRQRVVVTSKGTTVTFYSASEHDLQEVNTLTTVQGVTHLGYGETFADHDGTIQRTRFLIVFGTGRATQQFHQITVGTLSPAFAVGIAREWHASGEVMKVLQSDGRVKITVRKEHHLEVYELKEDFWMRFQILKVQSLTAPLASWTMFSTGFESYLAMVSPDQLTIFVQDGTRYKQIQVFSTSVGLSRFDGILAFSLKTCRGEVVLIAGNSKDVIAFVFDPRATTPQFKVAYRGSLSVTVSNWSAGFAYTSTTDGSSTMVLPIEKGAALFLVKAKLKDVVDPVLLETQAVAHAVAHIEEEYKRQKDVITAAEERLYYGVASHTEIYADITITRGIIVNQTLFTGKLEAVKMVFPGTSLAGGVSQQQYLTFISELRNPDVVLNELLDSITYIESALDDAVPTTGTNRTIGGLKTLPEPGFRLARMITTSTTVGKVLDATGASYPLDGILSSVVRGDNKRKIGGKKTFLNGLVVGELHTSYLDDVPVVDLVTTTGAQRIEGAVFVNGLVAEDIKMIEGGTVAGVDLSDAVLLSRPMYLGHVFSTNLEVERDVEVLSGVVDGVDIDHLYNYALTLSGGELAGSIEFDRDLVVDYLEGTRMMGIDVVDLLNNTVFRDEKSVMSGTLIVPQMVTMEKNLYAGDINSKIFPGNYPLKTSDEPLVFTGRKNFASLVIDQVTFGAQGLVDGIAPGRFVTKTTDQHITGLKIFAQGVDIDGHLDIASKIIDGVNLDDLFALKDTRLTQTDSDFKVIFKKPVWMPGLTFDGKLNGMSFSAIADDFVYTSGGPVRISGDKKFHRGLSIFDAEFTQTFNGERLEQLVTSDNEQVISGEITFETDVAFDTLIVEYVDGVDLIQLVNNALYLNKADQVVTGVKVFTNSVTAGSLAVEGEVKNVNFRNVVTKSGSQTFTAPQTLHHAKFASFTTHMIEMSDGYKINGVDFSALAAKRLPLREPVDHTAALFVDGPVTVIGTLTAENINGYNTRQLKNSIVVGNVDSVIEGPVIFSSLTVEGSVTTEGKVGGSGLNISAIAEGAVKLAHDNIFTGDVAFDTVELHGDVAVEGLVDGVDLAQLQHDAVYTDVGRIQNVTGKKVFRNSIFVKGDIIADRTNGIDLASRLFTLHTDQIITAPYSFADLAASENVYLQGLFNNFDLKRLAVEAVTREEETILGNVHFTKSVVVKNLELRNSLNDINVAERLRDAVRLQDSGVSVTGKKTFLVNTRFKTLNVDYLNSVDLDDFFANIVTINAAHQLSGAVTVDGVVSAPRVTAEDLTVDGTIDGVDYKQLKADVVYLSGEQDVDSELVFTDNIIVRGDINSVWLNSWKLDDYLTTNTEQTFSANVTFGSITTTYIDVKGRVKSRHGSWHLPTERANTLQSVGGQTVTGLTTVSGPMRVLGNVHVTGRVGQQVKVKLADQVVLLTDDAQVSGTVRFTSDLTVASLTSSTGVINNVYVPDLYKNAWYVDRPVTTASRYHFNGHTTLTQGLVSQGAVDGLIVHKVYRETTTAISMFHNLTQEFKVEFERVCEPIAALYDKLRDCPYEGDYFRHEKDFNFTDQHHSSITFFAWQTTFLIMSYEGECYSDVFVWHARQHSFVHYQRLESSGYGHQWLLLKGTDKVMVAMAASSKDNSCSNTNTTVWLVTDSIIEMFQLLAEGEHLSSESLPGSPLLHVHARHATLTYRYLAEAQSWRLVTESPPTEVGVEVGHGSSQVYFTVAGGVGQVRVDGTAAGTLDLAHATLHHAHLLARGNAVVLLLIVTTYTYKGPTHTLRVYFVNDGIPQCIAVETLQTAGQSTAFFAGNAAAGSIFIVITQRNLCPLVYALLGEVLTPWPELSVPRVSWIKHFEVPSERFPTVMDHHLLLGRRDKTASIYYLVMKGAALPEKEITCRS
ncbi:uncharacterized protein [Panulirus ornatus]